MKYIVVDASLHGTGIRDYYAGGYIDPSALGLSDGLVQRIRTWLNRYETEHYNSFQDIKLINALDSEGRDIARMLKSEVSEETKIDYFSSAFMRKEKI
ncbi:hypothetical protein GCM10023231_00640 [Olivibacter ginsenosidimutans]|uniref:Uncharacterized protein n=1 Tax=Olivibacter ginsenosidimutans TaxID=1176537 RepID=A0ABP9AD96_9SPHI